MQRIIMAVLLWAATTAQATEIHRRGDFQFEVGPVPDFVVSKPIPDRWDAKAPGADEKRWRYWRYDLQSDRREGRDEVYVDYAYEALSAAHLGDAGRFKISFNPEYQRLVVHRADLRRDGRWSDRLAADKVSLARREAGFEKDISDGVVTALVVLEDVRVGDVVRISYSVIGSNPVMAGQDSDWIRFAWTNPMLESSLRVLLGPDARPRIYRSSGSPEPVIRKTSASVEVLMRAAGVGTVVDEENYPVWFQPYPQAQVAVDQSWADVVAWGLPLYPPVEDLPAELESKLVQWRALPNDNERLDAALRMVQDQIRYFGVEMGENTHRPAPPSQTWQRRYGDCKDKAYLLATLLQRMGIEAAPALVSIDRGRAVADFVPSASDFDHVIVRAKLKEGGTVWVDPTLTQQGGDPTTVDLSDYGMVLPLAPGSAALQEVEPPQVVLKSTAVRERYDIPKSGTEVKLSIETVYQGASANYVRRSFASERADEMARRYSDYYRKRFGELSVLSGAMVEDDRKANRVKLSETYLLKAPFQDVGSNKAIDLYAESMQAVSALPSSMARKGPLDFAMPGSYSHEIKVVYPKGWKPTFVGEVSRHSSSAFDYERKVTIAPDQVDVKYELNVKRRELASGETSAHIDQMRMVREDLSARLGFSMDAPVSGKEREQRIKALLRTIGGTEGESK
jgi:transglutaminase-like putative cysteine protease